MTTNILDKTLIAGFDYDAYVSGILQIKAILTPAVAGKSIWMGFSIFSNNAWINFPAQKIGDFFQYGLFLWNMDFSKRWIVKPEDLQKTPGLMRFALWENEPRPDAFCRRLADLTFTTEELLKTATTSPILNTATTITDAAGNVIQAVETATGSIADFAKYTPLILIGLGMFYLSTRK